jgi:hypothetical protein
MRDHITQVRPQRITQLMELPSPHWREGWGEGLEEQIVMQHSYLPKAQECLVTFCSDHYFANLSDKEPKF